MQGAVALVVAGGGVGASLKEEGHVLRASSFCGRVHGPLAIRVNGSWVGPSAQQQSQRASISIFSGATNGLFHIVFVLTVAEFKRAPSGFAVHRNTVVEQQFHNRFTPLCARSHNQRVAGGAAVDTRKHAGAEQGPDGVEASGASGADESYFGVIAPGREASAAGHQLAQQDGLGWPCGLHCQPQQLGARGAGGGLAACVVNQQEGGAHVAALHGQVHGRRGRLRLKLAQLGVLILVLVLLLLLRLRGLHGRLRGLHGLALLRLLLRLQGLQPRPLLRILLKGPEQLHGPVGPRCRAGRAA